MVYLIHFNQPYKAHVNCQHYIGFSTDEETLQRRVEYHKKGRGSKYLKVVTNAGIEYKIVRTWPDGDRNFERKLKNQKNAKNFCPVCNPDGWKRRGKE